MTFVSVFNQLRTVLQQQGVRSAKIILNEKNRTAIEEELGNSKSYLGIKMIFVDEAGEVA